MPYRDMVLSVRERLPVASANAEIDFLIQRTGYSGILAMRPWRAEILNEFRKDRR
jgi:hypothetical protein